MKRKSRRIKKVCESHSNSHTAPPVTPDHHCLLNLVWWAHEHAGGCSSRPSLQKVLEERYGGAVRAVWSCADGHSYIMDTSNTYRINRNNIHLQTHRPIRTSTDNAAHVNRSPPHSPAHRNAAQAQSSTHSHAHTDKSDGAVGADEVLSHVQPVEESDLSDRIFSSEEEEDEMMKVSTGSRANIHTDKKSHSSKEVMITEPKERKKPGPKPGWKKKLKSEREDLPSIYKCPHQGCTAVYRGVDGMRKHVKEHHEEVKERPCPHPGCNKVFMIDRYLQRHIKLIHTEVRNYICDQCGQTFKQRKHLLVHQMRHSGAKPLQCEVCGFQCRQRASLKYHMTKHKAEAELEFVCSVCERRFEKAHNLKVHMSMVHPLLQEHNTYTDSQSHLILHTDPLTLSQSHTQSQQK